MACRRSAVRTRYAPPVIGGKSRSKQFSRAIKRVAKLRDVRKMKTFFLLFLPCFLVNCPLIAGLQLDGKVIEVKAKPEDEKVSTLFTFTNRGTRTVKILGIESACSCLSSTVDANSYAAGAKGVGTAEFKVGSFVGRHEKSVIVTTDDPDQPEFHVTFVLDVPEVIQIEPRTLQWWLDDEPVEKVAIIKMIGEDPMKVINITSTRDTVEFSWKETVPGKEYEIRVKPKSTHEVSLGALKVETDSKIPKYQRQLAFFSVYRKPGAASAAEAK